MTRYLSLALVLGLSACGYNEDAFTEDFASTFCAKMEECEFLDDMGYDDAADCEATLTDDSGSDSAAECDFDKDAAQTCIDDWEAASCDDPTAWPTCAGVCG